MVVLMVEMKVVMKADWMGLMMAAKLAALWVGLRACCWVD